MGIAAANESQAVITVLDLSRFRGLLTDSMAK